MQGDPGGDHADEDPGSWPVLDEAFVRAAPVREPVPAAWPAGSARSAGSGRPADSVAGRAHRLREGVSRAGPAVLALLCLWGLMPAGPWTASPGAARTAPRDAHPGAGRRSSAAADPSGTSGVGPGSWPADVAAPGAPVIEPPAERIKPDLRAGVGPALG